MEEREGVRLRVIAPRDRFITADDLIDALAPKTRIVSVSLVRYVFGERGAHARSAFGVAQIPFGSCVEIEIIVEVSDSDSECQV